MSVPSASASASPRPSSAPGGAGEMAAMQARSAPRCCSDSCSPFIRATMYGLVVPGPPPYARLGRRVEKVGEEKKAQPD